VWLPEEEKKWQGIVFTHFVCDGRRFVCESGLSPLKKQDISASFVRLDNNQYYLVHFGLQIVVSEGLVPKFLCVSLFDTKQKEVVGVSPTLIEPKASSMKEWIRMDRIHCSVIACRKPIRKTAELHESIRVAVPTLIHL